MTEQASYQTVLQNLLLQQRVAAQDQARRNSHAEARRQQAIKKWQAEKASEGTQRATTASTAITPNTANHKGMM